MNVFPESEENKSGLFVFSLPECKEKRAKVILLVKNEFGITLKEAREYVRLLETKGKPILFEGWAVECELLCNKFFKLGCYAGVEYGDPVPRHWGVVG